ncbi:MAG: hypothetical protein LUH82_01715 [Clostridiales bacterium]|nr:hypothetical protein [Clostridiales bacterium]
MQNKDKNKMDKQKKFADKKQKNINGKKVIDLSSYISPDMAESDTNGSYTGTTYDTYYGTDYEEPVQDADDL